MRPARLWSWVLLLVVALALTGVAAGVSGAPPRSPFGSEPAGAHLGLDRLGGADDAVAVLADRVGAPGVDRVAPRLGAVALLVLCVGFALAIRWRGVATRPALGPAWVPAPGGIGRRAPPPHAI
jgi:hypothetical protein